MVCHSIAADTINITGKEANVCHTPKERRWDDYIPDWIQTTVENSLVSGRWNSDALVTVLMRCV